MKIAYDINTGEIVGAGTHIDHMSSATVALLEGYCLPDTGYVKDGELVLYTNKQLQDIKNKPKHRASWSNVTMSWTDNSSEEEHRRSKYLDIKNMANITDFSNITINGKVYAADTKSRDIMSQKLLVALLLSSQSTFEIEWVLVDNTTISLNFEELKNVLSYIESRSVRIFNKKRELKAEIYSIDISKLSSIRWPDFV